MHYSVPARDPPHLPKQQGKDHAIDVFANDCGKTFQTTHNNSMSSKMQEGNFNLVAAPPAL